MRILDDKLELWPYILASFLLHVLLLVLIPKAIVVSEFKDEPIEVFAVEDSPKSQEAWRIADIAEPKIQQKPKSAKFLGIYDSAVSEEVVGIGERQGKTNPPKPVRQRWIESSKDKLFAFNKDIFDDRPSPPKDADEHTSGGLDDFYPDFRRGVHTYLNVLRHPGVEYFVRLKHAFKLTFNPEPPLREYFSQNRVTRGSIDVVLGVSVNRTGELAELFVFRSSGVKTYDEEALRTVRASAPFATPPEKFLSDDGLLRMSWTFSVYL